MTFSVDTVGGDGRVGYRSQISHSSSVRVYSKGENAIHVIRTGDINHSSLFNFGKKLMVLVEVDLGIQPDLLHPIIQVIMVYHLVFIVMVITEVVIGLTPDNFIHITMVD